MQIRKHLCWWLGHKYRAIWFKKNRFGDQAGIADTESGCIYCGHTDPNFLMLNINDIDWEATQHRINPPKHNVYEGEKSYDHKGGSLG